MAGATRSADGWTVAAVADQQGNADIRPTSDIAVTAAIEAALDADMTLPVEQIARIAFAAAQKATADSVGTTTLLIVVAAPGPRPHTHRVAFIWVGDSRGYLITSAQAEQVTTDHTLSMAESAETTPIEQPIQQITRRLGRGSTDEPELEVRDITGPAQIVLTTDELHDFYTNPHDLGAITRAADLPGQAADQLINNVLTQGSGNKTAIVIDTTPTNPNPPTHTTEPTPTKPPKTTPTHTPYRTRIGPVRVNRLFHTTPPPSKRRPGAVSRGGADAGRRTGTLGGAVARATRHPGDLRGALGGPPAAGGAA